MSKYNYRGGLVVENHPNYDPFEYENGCVVAETCLFVPLIDTKSGDIEIAADSGIIKMENFAISGNTLSSTDLNGNIIFDPDGVGDVNIASGDLDVDIGDLRMGGALTITNAQAIFGTSLEIDDVGIDGDTIRSLVSGQDLNLAAPGMNAGVNISAGDLKVGGIVIINNNGTLENINSLTVDNITLDGSTISTTGTNLNITPDATFSLSLQSGDFKIGNTSVITSTRTITNIVSGNIGGVTFASNTIATGMANSDLIINPNGTGDVIIQGQTFPASDGTADQILSTDGSGNLSWTDASSLTVTTVSNNNKNVTADDQNLLVTATASGGGTVNINLEAASDGIKLLRVKDSGGNAATKNIDINADGSDTIDGNATVTINTDYGSYTLLSDGVNTWNIV